jgi:translation initiation factor 2 subunit 1
MKSKTVSSIIRHVASKIPSVNADGSEEVKSAEVEEKEHEAKKNRRAQRKEAQERGEEIPEDEGAMTSASEEERCEQLYDTIAWPLGKIYGHPYDAFKLALTCAPPFAASSL